MKRALCFVVAVACLAAVVLGARVVPKAPSEVPQDYVEPMYTDGSMLELETNKAHRDDGDANADVNPGDASVAPVPAAPGPWLSSYHTMIGGGIGNMVPPYAFDPTNFGQMGPYRALSNKFSDGTSYPLNMEKFDYYNSHGKKN